MDMHRSGQVNQFDTSHLRLRYSTQFTINGRTHTIEMEIPVPVGASAEEREHLMREAEASIEQLYRQLEKRGSPRSQTSVDANRMQESTGRARPGNPSPPPQQTAQADVRPSMPPSPTRQPVASQQVPAQTNPRETAQPIPLQNKRETPETAAPPSSRASIGSEMPVTPNLNSSTAGTVRLPEFIQLIRNNWGLTPKDAMELLQVSNLNNMNYRELLRQLEPLVEQRAKAAPKNAANNAPRPAASSAPASHPSVPSSSPTVRDASARPAPSSPIPAPKPANAANRVNAPAPASSSPKPPASSSPAPPASPALDGPPNIPVFPLPASTLREVPRSYKFDEEEEAQDDNNTDDDDNGMSNALARIKIDELKEIRGTATASPGRLTVLHNLLDSQISDTQFQQLIEGLWNITSDKKLKQDHVEVLISWAKEDYFEDEVRAVLSVMNG